MKTMQKIEGWEAKLLESFKPDSERCLDERRRDNLLMQDWRVSLVGERVARDRFTSTKLSPILAGDPLVSRYTG
jgi:hypothetical protein